MRKNWAKLTEQKLDGIGVDDSNGLLVKLVDIKWFASLLTEHNDPAFKYYLDLFEPFVIGRDLNLVEDIVYINISSLWFILNIFRRCLH